MPNPDTTAATGQQRPSRPAIVAGLLSGYAIWLLSKPVTGRSEPWDAGGAAAAYYPAALFAAGFLGLLFTRKRRPLLWSIYFGQVAFLFTGPEGPGGLFPLGLIVLVFYMLPALLGAWIAGFIVKNEDAGGPSTTRTTSGNYLDD